jgi:subtilisin family serine protease
VKTGQWHGNVTVDPVTTEYRPMDEKAIFRFRVLDAAGALGVDTEIPWFLNMMNCQKAWELTRGEGAIVVVSDQGFHLKHPELVDHIKAKKHFGPRSIDDRDQNFHGTDMSRILLGVAPEVRIIPVRCSARRMEDLAPQIAKSFDFAAEQKADVITASWSARFQDDETLQAAVQNAAASGVCVSWFHYPHSDPRILRSSFTYAWWEEEPRLGFADRFLTTDLPGFHPVEIEAGLSGTAPQAAGLAALVKSVNPKLSPAEVKRIMFENSDSIGGALLIPNAYRIVQAAQKKATR